MKKNQAGFGAVEALLILVIIGLIGVIGWYVWQARQDSDATVNSRNASQQTDTDKEVTWVTYENDEGKFTFQYPNTWTSEVDETTRYGGGEFGGVEGSVTAPSGQKLTWAYRVDGGKGGHCEPDAGEVPFTKGNKCFSKQIISLEKLPSIEPPQDMSFRNLFEDAIYITRTKYMGSDGNISYQICLDAVGADRTPKVGTSMGLLFPCEYWSTGFNVKFMVESESEFTSDEAKTAEQIMKTFNSL